MNDRDHRTLVVIAVLLVIVSVCLAVVITSLHRINEKVDSLQLMFDQYQHDKIMNIQSVHVPDDPFTRIFKEELEKIRASREQPTGD